MCKEVSVDRGSSAGLGGNSAKPHRQLLAPSAISDWFPYNRKHISDLAFTSRDSASLWCTLWSQQPFCYASCWLSWQLGSPHLHVLQLLLLWVGLGFTWTVSCRPVPPSALLRGLVFHTSLPLVYLTDESSPASYPKPCCRKNTLRAAVMKVTLFWMQELHSKVTCCLKPATKGRWLSDITTELSWKQDILVLIKIHRSCDFYRNSKKNPG